MEHPSYGTIARFKVDYFDLIYEAFKTTIKIAKNDDLIKIHHLSLDVIKIKVKTSINKLIDENQIKIMKEQLQKSIERDQQENEELGDESGNSVHNHLTDKQKFKETVKEIRESFKNSRNKYKLCSSSLNLLKQTERIHEKVLKKLNELEEKLKESSKDVISINAYGTSLMMNEKCECEWDYYTQIIVNEYKGIIISSYITQNPTYHFGLIPSIEELENNLSEIYG